MQNLILSSIDVFFRLLYFLIFARIILSWIPVLNQSALGGLLYALTEPIMGPVRDMVNKSPIGGGMMLDFSPIIALFLMDIAKAVLLYLVRFIF